MLLHRLDGLGAREKRVVLESYEARYPPQPARAGALEVVDVLDDDVMALGRDAHEVLAGLRSPFHVEHEGSIVDLVRRDPTAALYLPGSSFFHPALTFENIARSSYLSRAPSVKDCGMSLLVAASLASLVAAAAIYCIVQVENKDLKHGVSVKQTDKLSVNAAACFCWLALSLMLVHITGSSLGLVGSFSLVLVLLYLSLDVKAVHSFVGPLKDFSNGDPLKDRSTQISAASFAVGSVLLSTRRDLAPKVAPLVFMAILLSVSSSITSTQGKQCVLRKSSDWEAVQKAGIAISAGLLALAVGICVDESLLPSFKVLTAASLKNFEYR